MARSSGLNQDRLPTYVVMNGSGPGCGYLPGPPRQGSPQAQQGHESQDCTRHQPRVQRAVDEWQIHERPSSSSRVTREVTPDWRLPL
jgi:hypothetical protein